MTIGKKILLACALLLLMGISATGIVLNTMYYQTLVNSTSAYTAMLVEQIAVNLSTRTKEFEDSIYNTVQQWDLFGEYFNDGNSLEYHKRGMLSSFVNTRNTTASPVLDLYLMDEKDDFYYYNYQSQSFRGGLESVKAYMTSVETALPEGTRAEWFTVPEEDGIVYLMRHIYDVSTLRYVGMVAVGIERSLIQNQFEKLETSQNGHLIIFGQEKTPVFGSLEGLPDGNALLKLGERVQPEAKLVEIRNSKYVFQCKGTEDEK
ncbi:MAG: hypothetical protein PHR92_00170 [Lachnospiraceae bacterium]|nr:hypothetical protein [Lachnospiraceae bacterium]